MSDDGPARVLVADDQADVRFALELLLRGAGVDVRSAGSPAGVLAEVEAGDFDAVLIDMNYARDTTSGREGYELLDRLRALDPTLPVVVMTAWAGVDSAVEAMRRGARDYVAKPWDNDRLLATLRTQTELRRARAGRRRLEGEAARERERGLPDFVAQSPAMLRVKTLVARVGPSEANVLITGEHGTGKEVVARWLHASSRRAGGAFVAVNAGALSDGVFESELFGHVKGAFTDAKSDRVGCFELAHGGTLFLDEIGTMPVGQQAKLLRVLQTGEFRPVGSSKLRRVDVRVLSATNVDVAREVSEGRFREDLLYRLNTVEVALPPLRDRPDDVVELARHFLARHAGRYASSVTGFDEGAAAALRAHAWPGNVRELEHAVERALLLAQSGAIAVDDLGLKARVEGDPDRIERMTLDDAERYLIRRALERAGGNVVDAARALGLSRSALYRRLQTTGGKVNE